MDAKTVEFVTAKTHDLMAAPSCNPTLKTAAQAWLPIKTQLRRLISKP